MAKARLQELYETKIRPELIGQLKLGNPMQAPKLTKIVLNVGSKEAVADSKIIQVLMESLKKVSGQMPVRTLARKSIASFKLRAGMPIGVKVTLRRAAMYDFLDKLINLALPKVRDFQGVPTKFDGRGNYNLGLKDVTIFPEIDFDVADKVHGLNITIAIAAQNDEHAFELLKSFSMPFKR